MATNRDFNNMLNEYLTIDMMKNELIKRTYVLQKIDRDDGWKGGTIPVPFEGQYASSISFGSLPASNNISKYKYVRGQLTTQKEVWGSLKFNHRDIMEQDGKVNEKSFLKMLPGQIDDFVNYMKDAVSINLLGGPHFAAFTVDGTAGGVIEVDRVDRFTIDQELVIDDGNSSPLTVFVIAIDVNGGTLAKGAVTVSATRGGAAADVSAYTVAQSAKCYHPGAQTDSFTSITTQVLSAANGGATSLFGVTKTAWPFLQAVQYNGSSISATNILSHLFDAYARRQLLAKSGKIPEILMSYKHFGTVLKLLELGGGFGGANPAYKGAYNVVPGSREISAFGWQKVSIGSVDGSVLTLVALQEMQDTEILYLDWSTLELFTNGFFQRRKSPDGQEYFEERNTDGYTYIVDQCMFGDLVVKNPSKNLVIHSIPNY